MAKLVCVLFALLQLSLEAGDFSFRKIIDITAPIPGRPANFNSVSEPILLPSGQVAFIGSGTDGTSGVYRADGQGRVISIAENTRLLPGYAQHFSSIPRAMSRVNEGVAFVTTWPDQDIDHKAWIYDGTLTAQPMPPNSDMGFRECRLRYQNESLLTYLYKTDGPNPFVREPWAIRDGRVRRIVTRGDELHPGSGLIFTGGHIISEGGGRIATDGGIDYFTARYVHAGDYAYESTYGPGLPQRSGLFSANSSTVPITYRAIAVGGWALAGISSPLADNFIMEAFSYDGSSLLFKSNFADGARSIVRGRNGQFSKILDFPFVDETGATITNTDGVLGGFDGRVFLRTNNSAVFMLRPNGEEGYSLHRVAGAGDLIDGKVVESIQMDHNASSLGDSIALILRTVGGGGGIYLASLDANAGQPEIQQVGSGPIPAINARQSVTITGLNFHPDCKVTLRDHRTGEIFRDRTKVSQTASSIQLSVNFTAIPAEWSVEVVNPDGKSSGLHRFQVGVPMVPGGTVDRLVVSGPDSIQSGETATFTAILRYLDGTEVDVTHSAVFRTVGPVSEGVTLQGNELRSDPSLQGFAMVSANFQTTHGGIEAFSSHFVSILGKLHIKIFRVEPVSEADPFTVRATTSMNQAGDGFVFSWDFDGGGAFDDGPNQAWATYTYPSLSGERTVRVKVVNQATGEEAVAEHRFRIQKQLAVNQPIRPKTVNIAGLGKFYKASGGELVEFGFSHNRIGNGLIVLVHGMNSNGRAAWLEDMTQAIEGAITDFRDSSALPNIVIYDWERDAKTGIAEKPLDGKNNNDITDIIASGITHGGHLANWIRAQSIAGLIDSDSPIHFIGHSAGGFVIGQAASNLAPGIHVDRVTMLDTPKPWLQHFEVLRKRKTPLDRLITSNFGSQEYFRTPAPDGNLYIKEYFPSFFVAVGNLFPYERGHGLAYRRYQTTATVGDGDFLTAEGVTFRNSPFILGPLNPNRQTMGGIRFPKSQSPGDEVLPITSLSRYGTTEDTGTGHRLVENAGADSGIFAQLEVPVGAYAIEFTYRFLEGDEEDLLVASAGGDTVPILIPNLPLYRTREFQGWLEVAELGSSSVTLDFRLEGTGDANTRVVISNIRFLISDDVDGDGIPNEEEITRGTNPMSRDTDGDGLSDYDEIHIHLTDPRTADTDSDGVRDDAEIAAGTDPLSASSIFRITEVSTDAENNVKLIVPCAPGKTYRLRGSRTPYGLTNWTIQSGIRSDGGTATVIDTGRRLEEGRFFYWLEVETAE